MLNLLYNFLNFPERMFNFVLFLCIFTLFVLTIWYMFVITLAFKYLAGCGLSYKNASRFRCQPRRKRLHPAGRPDRTSPLRARFKILRAGVTSFWGDERSDEPRFLFEVLRLLFKMYFLNSFWSSF